MRKQVFGRQFNRTKNQRKALFSGLISAVISKGRIETTEEKAKAIKGDLEKLVTKAKKGEGAKRLLQKDLKPFEIDKMINQIAPAFANRPGGYTRIIRTGKRFNDNASMVILEWVEEIKAPSEVAPKAKKAASAKQSSKQPVEAKVAISKPKKETSTKKAAKGKSSVAKAKEDK